MIATKTYAWGDAIPRGAPTAVELGFFDGVHKGHAAVIGAATAHAATAHAAQSEGMETAVVTFRRRPELPGGPPAPEITCRALKEQILQSLRADTVAYLDFEQVRDLSPSEFLELLCGWFDVRFVSCGFNYRFGKNAAAGARELKELCAARGIVAAEAAPVCVDGGPVSSTRIRALLERGDAVSARRLMGRPFAFWAEVVHGRQLGRTLGTPTINQVPEAPQLFPRYGVYASRVELDGRLWPGVTSVGVKPTVEEHAQPSAETYIPGFSGDLYGRTLRVDLLEFLRPELRFGGLEALKAQMGRDTEQALQIAEGDIHPEL